eukprot:2749832-Pleurochrysis_carterae.AAC.1
MPHLAACARLTGSEVYGPSAGIGAAQARAGGWRFAVPGTGASSTLLASGAVPHGAARFQISHGGLARAGGAKARRGKHQPTLQRPRPRCTYEASGVDDRTARGAMSGTTRRRRAAATWLLSCGNVRQPLLSGFPF